MPEENKLPEAVKWVPQSDAEEKRCFQLYGEYVHNRTSIIELALRHKTTDYNIRKMVKWVAYVKQLELADNKVVKQMADSALLDHIGRIEAELESCGMSSVRASLLKERRLALKDLAEIRGVRDFGEEGARRQSNQHHYAGLTPGPGDCGGCGGKSK